MDTKAVYLATISIAVGALIWQMAGFAAVFDGAGPGDDLQSDERFRDQAQNGSIQQGAGGSVSQTSDNIVGLIITGLGGILNFIFIVVMLPWELKRMGLPWYGAYPLGILGWTVSSIGIGQVVSGRIFR